MVISIPMLSSMLSSALIPHWPVLNPIPTAASLSCILTYSNIVCTDCQVKFGLTHNEYAGLGHGEPPEQAWSMLGGFGMRTMSLALAHRAVALEYAMQAYNLGKREGLPELLVKMLKKAESQEKNALNELEEIKAFAAAHNLVGKLNMDLKVRS